MSASTRDELLKFLEVHQSEEFVMKTEIEAYCRSDVYLLAQAAMKFRDIVVAEAAVDPYDHMTIASVCMANFRQNFLREEHLIQLVEDGDWIEGYKWKGVYHRSDTDEPVKPCRTKFVSSPIAHVPARMCAVDTHSKGSIQWLEWVQHCKRLTNPECKIQHALNGREKKIGKYRVDGYDESSHTALEYHGCLIHGCTQCFQQDRFTIKEARSGKSMHLLQTLTKIKESYITSQGFAYVCIYECAWKKELSKNERAKAFVDKLDVASRLDVRDAFFGKFKYSALKISFPLMLCTNMYKCVPI